jgi:cytochrome P450
MPVAAQALSWTFRPGPFLERCQRDYGDIFTVRLEMGEAPRVLIADPQAAVALLSKPSLTVAPSSRATIRPVFGEESVAMANGEEHKQRRQAMVPAFRSGRLDRYREMIVSSADREIDSWTVGQTFALRPQLQSMTLAVILDVVFGNRDAECREEIGRQIDRLLAVIANRAGGFAIALPSWIRARFAARFASWRSELDTLVRKEMATRRADPSPGEPSDALSHLMSSGGDGREPLSDQSICDQVCTLLLAGHETTAVALAWSIEHLVHDPQAFDRLGSALNDPDGGERYADAVITETLRLNPPLINTQRQLTTSVTLGDYTLPSDTLIAPCAYLIHRRPDVYPDPHAFKPERFLDFSPGQEIWWPFGGGARRCLGASFARFQMNLILRRLFERTHLQAAAPHRHEQIRKRGILFAPSRGTRVVVTERRPG